MKRKILRFLKRIWLLHFLRRIYFASKYPARQFKAVIKWGFASKEDTNYTYELAPDNILYLAHLIAIVTKKNHKEVLTYIHEVQNDQELIQHIQRETEKSDLKKFADKEVRFAKRLGWYAFIRIIKPTIVVETGIDKGLGSVLLCSALLKNKAEGFSGKYYGTDINPQAGYLLSGKYKEVGEILLGDSIESLKKLKEPIELFINDSDHSTDYEFQEYKTIQPLLNDKSIILGDNSHASDKLALFSQETGRSFLFFKEKPINHWYEGSGIGVSFK